MRFGRIRVFLSYAREDEQRVRRLYDNLKAADFRPWMDVTDLRSGEPWEVAIHRGIRSSDVFLALVSPKSVQKTGVLQDEIQHALERWKTRFGSGLHVVPVRLDPNVELPAMLQSLQWSNLFEDDDWRQLAPAIRKAASRQRLRRHLIAITAFLVLGLVLSGWLLWPRYTSVTELEEAGLRAARHPLAAESFSVERNQLRAWQDGSSGRIGVTVLLAESCTDSPGDWKAVRSGAPVRVGDHLRLRIEAGRQGYLYVFDESVFADGSRGNPELVLPDPGELIHLTSERRIVDFPPKSSEHPCWTVGTNTSLKLTAEKLTFVLVEHPLRDPRAPENARRIVAAASRWEPGILVTEDPNARIATKEDFAVPQGAKDLVRYPPPQRIYSVPGDDFAMISFLQPVHPQ